MFNLLLLCTCEYGPHNIMCVCTHYATHGEDRGKLFGVSLYSTMGFRDKTSHQVCIIFYLMSHLTGPKLLFKKKINWVAGIVLNNLYFIRISCQLDSSMGHVLLCLLI